MANRPRITDPAGATGPVLPRMCPVCAAAGWPDGDTEMPGLSVWLVAQRPAWVQRRGLFVPGSTAHPARMLPELARHAIHTYSRPGQIVFDPLAGSGTTLVAALHAGRDAIGVEYEPRWAALARTNARLARAHTEAGAWQVRRGDATRLPGLLPRDLRGQVDLVLTSPPYGRTMHGRVEHRHGPLTRFHNQYGPPDPASLAHRGLTGIAEGMYAVLAGCLPLLRPGGTVIITARPWRRTGLLRDLPGAITAAALDTGLQQVDRCVALLAAVRDGHLLPRHSFHQLTVARKTRARNIPVHLIAHEDILIFRAPPGDDRIDEPHHNTTAARVGQR